MKTIYVVLGVAVLAGGAAVLLGSSGSGRNCERVVIDAPAMERMENAMPGLVKNLTPDSPGLELFRGMFRAAFPGCSFANSDPTVIVDGNGVEVAWPSIVAVAKGKTLMSLASDPTFIALFGPAIVPGREGAGFLDTALALQRQVVRLMEAVSSTLSPFVPDGKTWGPKHYYRFNDAPADHGGMGGDKPIETIQDNGRWTASVAKDYTFQDFYGFDDAPTEAEALNKVRLLAYYGP